MSEQTEDDYQRLEVLYDVTTGHLDAPEDTWEELEAWNINKHRLLWVEVRSIGKEDFDAAYTHNSSGRQGILLCYQNHKDRDDHAEGMRLHPSEVGWQSSLMAKMRIEYLGRSCGRSYSTAL